MFGFNNSQNSFFNDLNLNSVFQGIADIFSPSQEEQNQRSPSYNQQNQEVPDVNPTFQNTRSNWRKSDNKDQKKKKKKEETKKEEPKPNTGAYWKLKANEAYQKNYIDLAIEYYSRAIQIDNSESIYYSNRARCYKIRGMLKQAYEDAVYSIELDENNIKAQLLCGQLLCEIGKNEKELNKIQNGIKRLTRALTLCSKNDKKQYEKDICVYIYRAKKLLWYRQYEDIQSKKQELLQQYKQQLIDKKCTEQQIENELKKVYLLIGDPNKKPEFQIPDYLCCKISLDLMEEPVTTEAGHTYERSVLEEHFKKNGFVDPITRQKVNKEVYQNLSIKQGVTEFLNSNPWAFEFSQDEDYKNIEF